MTAGNASQLSDGASACVLMEAKLAQERGLAPLGLYRGMTVVGIRPSQVRPADVVAGPVALPVPRIADEFLVGHGHPRCGAWPAVVRNARIRAQAGAGQHSELPPGQEGADVLQDPELVLLELR